MMTEKIDKLLELLTHEKHFRVRLFWEGIGSAFSPGDRRELDLLLPKAMPILVSEL